MNENLCNKFDSLEEQYLKEVLGLDTRSATSGSFTNELEKVSSKVLNRKYAIAQNSGTSTLHSALLALGISDGDEVISPSFTVIMNTAVTLQCGAIPIYVDVDPETYCICPKDLRKKITNKTKAIQVVSVYGQSPEYDEIMAIANEFKIPVIEDNAECIDGFYKGKLVGTFGVFSSYSLEDSKHLSCGEGGLLLGDDEDLMTLARKYAGHGFRTLHAENGRIRLNPNEWQHPNFLRHDHIGYNYRLSEFQSAVALAQFAKKDELVKWRKKSGKAITEILSASDLFSVQVTPGYIEHSFWCVGARYKGNTNEWEKFRDKLFEISGERIFGAWQVPYLEPVMQNGNFKRHLNKDFHNIKYEKGLCPNAEEIQKGMMVFKTKYRNDKSLENLINGIEKTIKHFS
jgi:perosamine synthetase